MRRPPAVWLGAAALTSILGTLEGWSASVPSCPAPDAAAGISGLSALLQIADAASPAIRPTERTCSSATYRFPERTLEPGQSLEFEVPNDLQGRGVAFMILGHRQPAEKEKGDWDQTPGLSSVQVLGKFAGAEQAEWRYWGGSSSGEQGAKYAEPRPKSDPEMENLYDWGGLGHHGVNGGSHSKAPLKPIALKVVSTGTSPVLVSELTLKVSPPQADDFATGVFSAGTAFPQPGSSEKPRFGGGQKFKGRFPGALVLNALGKESSVPMPQGWGSRSGELRIPIPKGRKLTSVEIACGDSYPDEKPNSDGGFGLQGWGRLTVELHRANGKRETLMNRENVPPEGLLVASPVECDRKSGEGEQLVIQASGSPVYIMGVRIGTR